MEIWVPYGDVEALLTLQAENLGEVIEGKAEDHIQELADKIEAPFKESSRMMLCDSRSPTLRILQALVRKNPPPDGFRVVTPFAKEVEQKVPELKGKVVKFQEGREKVVAGGSEVASPPDLLDTSSKKLILGTAIPDPLLGVVDSKVGIVMAAMGGAKKIAYASRETDEPSTPSRNRSYEALLNISEMVPGAHFATIFSKGGEPNSLVEGPTIDEARQHFQTVSVAPAKAVIVSPGGRGYDGTLSQAIRLLWNVTDVVKKSGEILLISECREGIGSEALQMLVTGRISTEAAVAPKKASNADGAEEISYVNRLRQDYTITLLSALPDLYSGTRLRFRTAANGVEAIGKVLASAGRSTKFHVVPRLCETLVSRSS